MASIAPTSGHSGHRTLAAIVFTDAVGFSARMQRDEMSTMAQLQHDFAEMRSSCLAHQGTVLKTTGDGLLMTFSSAVHAVACALAMQRLFAAAAKARPGDEALQHRIGIHLGDVLVQDQDVMGDGVNIAARLQAEAEPGGICISQTVYDVVKNKIELHVISIGPRELKNISETIPVYRLLMDAHALAGTSRPASGIPQPRPPAKRWTVSFVALGAAAALGIAVASFVLLRRPPAVNPAPAAASAALSASTVKAVVTPAPARSSEEEGDREIAARMEDIQQLRTQYLEKYDFDGLARAMREKNDSPASKMGQQPLMMRSVENMVTMKDWLMVSLRNFGRNRPLAVSDFSRDASKEMKVYLASDKRVMFIEGGVPQARELGEIKPAVLGAIIVGALRHVKPMAPREVFMGAMGYSKLFNLPLMQEALSQPRGRADKEAARKK